MPTQEKWQDYPATYSLYGYRKKKKKTSITSIIVASKGAIRLEEWCINVMLKL